MVEAGHAGLAGRLEHGLGPEHVGAEEEARVQHGQRVVRLGGEVDDRVDRLAPQRLLGGRRVADVALDEDDPVLDVGQVGSVAGVGEHVVDDDVVLGVPFDPVAGEVRPDETGTSRDEKAHRAGHASCPPPGEAPAGSGAAQVDDVAGRHHPGPRRRCRRRGDRRRRWLRPSPSLLVRPGSPGPVARAWRSAAAPPRPGRRRPAASSRGARAGGQRLEQRVEQRPRSIGRPTRRSLQAGAPGSRRARPATLRPMPDHDRRRAGHRRTPPRPGPRPAWLAHQQVVGPFEPRPRPRPPRAGVGRRQGHGAGAQVEVRGVAAPGAGGPSQQVRPRRGLPAPVEPAPARRLVVGHGHQARRRAPAGPAPAGSVLVESISANRRTSHSPAHMAEHHTARAIVTGRPSGGKAQRAREDPHRQPRRDRRPGHPDLPRDGHRHRRRVLEPRPRRAARAHGRRGLRPRGRDGGRELPQHRGHPRRPSSRAGPTASTPATASSPRTPTSPGPSPSGASRSSGRRPRRSRSWATRSARAWPPRRPAWPACPGRSEPLTSPDEVVAFGEEHGWPVAIKAAYGGGGRGMKVVASAAEAAEAMESAAREAQAYFGRPEIYLERYLTWPRHVEMQVLADTHGNTLWLGERDCSAQRRHQKLVEESPAPDFPDEVRQAMGAAAVKVLAGLRLLQRRHRRVPLPGRRVLLPRDEHPAPGRAPGHRAGHRPRPGGLADPHRLGRGPRLRPGRHRAATGTPSRSASTPRTRAAGASRPPRAPSTRSTRPSGPGVRLDAGYEAGDTVSQYYDNLIAKLIVWAPDREAARRRMLRAIGETRITGVATTLPADVAILEPPRLRRGHALDQVGRGDARPERPHGPRPPPATAATDEEDVPTVQRDVTAEVDGRRYSVRLWVPDLGTAAAAGPAPPGRPRRAAAAAVAGTGSGQVTVPMQGTIVKVLVAVGDAVEVGQTICLLEAMKMENAVASREGRASSRRCGSSAGRLGRRRRRRRGHRVDGRDAAVGQGRQRPRSSNATSPSWSR